MATVGFYLKQPKAKDESLIYMVFMAGQEQFKMSTTKKIKPKEWDADDQRPKRTFSGYSTLRGYLTSLAADVEAAYIQLQSKNEPFTIDDIKDLVFRQQKRKPEPKVIPFFSFVEDYIARMAGLKTNTTLKSYKNTRNHLRAFEKTIWPKKLSFESFDQAFYSGFTQFLIQEKKLANNTIGNQIKNLKVFLNDATELGINKTFEYKKKKFKKLSEESDSIYLTEAEIQDLFNLNLSEKPSLQRVRDLFIIGCWTGLRFSDFTKLRKENITDEMISVRTQKTDQAVMIPIHPMVKQIFDRYTENKEITLPKAISNQKMNDYLKEIGKKAELDQKISITLNRGIIRDKKIYHKHELLTTHTARRSFATNLYLQGFPAISIMRITGHKSERAFLKYIKVSQEENARKLMEFWRAGKNWGEFILLLFFRYSRRNSSIIHLDRNERIVEFINYFRASEFALARKLR